MRRDRKPRPPCGRCGAEVKGARNKYCSRDCQHAARRLSAEGRRVSRLEATKRGQKQKRDLLQAIKLERGCADCGYAEDPVALDFDHRPGERKELKIATAVTQVGLERLLAEVEKCDVVCANCHRIRTYSRGQHRVLRSPA